FYCDVYASGPADGSARTDPKCGPQESPEGLKIFRGGSCFFEPKQMRAAMRLRNWPTFRNQTVGFRIARSLAR
ncbi:MAG TPA: SUMF1/EgtB/PvdO family nonheme iron enzyme, partial [Hyphomicrobium sp.]|nr:SUMF1/EgtB/PvdO family nonheme iron enzyme [Hyphomicrobium sp.]